MVAPGQPSRGFSLIELLTVVVILGVLLSLAALPIQEMIANQRLRSVTSDLVADLALARVEALKRSTRVGIARTTADWGGGWQVFNDERPADDTIPPDGVFTPDADGDGQCDIFAAGPPVSLAEECVLASRPPLDATVRVCSADAAFDVLTFAVDGTVRAYNAGAPVLPVPRITVSSTLASASVPARRLEFSPGGRVAVVSVGVAACP